MPARLAEAQRDGRFFNSGIWPAPDGGHGHRWQDGGGEHGFAQVANDLRGVPVVAAAGEQPTIIATLSIR
jgi:hypothetical protein